jgi:hypothetical protein
MRGAPKHPIQPLVTDKQGVLRFKANAIVRFLLDAGPYDLNKLALMPFSDEDRRQLAQLQSATASASYGELSYVSNSAYMAADQKAAKARR